LVVALWREQADDVIGHGVDPLVAGLVSPGTSKHRVCPREGLFGQRGLWESRCVAMRPILTA